MNHIRLFLIIALPLIVAGCVKESPTAPTQDLVVVQAYLYANEPVNTIRLTQVIPLGSEESKAPPINGAAVSLIRGGVETPLVPTPGDSGYYHDESGLTVQSGDDFSFRVLYNGQTITGTTTVPPAPQNLTLSSDTLAVSTDFGPPSGGFGGTDTSQTLTVTWNAESGALYYVVLENMETDTVAIDSFGGFGPGMRRMISEPTSSSEYRIRRFDVSYLGTHRVTVYRVNQEYADLYQSRQQDSRDLNEPLTNIQNGLGVFSAFNSSEAVFEVIKE